MSNYYVHDNNYSFLLQERACLALFSRQWATHRHLQSDAMDSLLQAIPVIEETLNLRQLAKHMAQHNTDFFEAQCLGVMTAMVSCIKEMILDGKNVKIDDLAIFSCGIRNSKGAASEEDFTVMDNIDTVKFRAHATGLLSNKQLDLEATLKRATAVAGTKAKKAAAKEQIGNI